MMIDLTFLKMNPELAQSVKLEVTGADLLAFGQAIHRLASEERTPDTTEEYLTPQQFADILQISLVTLWSWDKKQITRPLRIGTQKRYRKSDIEKILINENK